ncbi:flagellar basal body rod protein FlgB [Asticcacaulis tiandongensis]|uniref:flagellar basal body rod protein FlgB n=1 Tax=Asticcacaulis tiandongensis TaxID=2565365 RepID=UPI001128F998|nr:flagellar basal body rod protein FlgB [Asticcacaulis tiandongensis]
MNLDKIGLFGALQTKMGWLGERQKVVAQNVANASTPGFRPRDLKPVDFAAVLAGDTQNNSVPLRLTNAGHMDIQGGSSAHRSVISPDSETTMDGNQVVLEEQMLKMAESRMQFEAAIGFYQKSLGLIRMAGKAPGR